MGGFLHVQDSNLFWQAKSSSTGRNSPGRVTSEDLVRFPCSIRNKGKTLGDPHADVITSVHRHLKSRNNSNKKIHSIYIQEREKKQLVFFLLVSLVFVVSSFGLTGFVQRLVFLSTPGHLIGRHLRIPYTWDTWCGRFVSSRSAAGLVFINELSIILKRFDPVMDRLQLDVFIFL